MRHPYLLSIMGVIVLLVVGTIIVDVHAPVTVINSASSWNSPTTPYYPSYASRSTETARPMQQVTQNTPVNTRTMGTQNPSSFSYSPEIPANPAAKIAGVIINTDSSFDFNGFMQQLADSAPRTLPVIPTTIGSQETYQTIPQDLFITPDITAPARTDTQQTLHTYGNTAGAHIQKYEQLHSNDVAVVQDYFDARNNAGRTIALRQLADDLKNIGVGLKAIGNVPAPLVSIHSALADSYVEIGEKLATIPSVTNDTDLVKAILAYDDAVEANVKQYVALVLKFSQSKITFAPDEPGSVFMFAQQ